MKKVGKHELEAPSSWDELILFAIELVRMQEKYQEGTLKRDNFYLPLLSVP